MLSKWPPFYMHFWFKKVHVWPLAFNRMECLQVSPVTLNPRPKATQISLFPKTFLTPSWAFLMCVYVWGFKKFPTCKVRVPKVDTSSIPTDVGVWQSKKNYMNTLVNPNEEDESWSCYFQNECGYLMNSRIGAHRFS